MTPPAAAPAHALPGVRRAPVRHPRRVSGPAAPARRPARTQPPPAIRRPARPQPSPGIALRAIDALDSASRSALIDRLIRGRIWIGALAFALIGIVAMQLFVFKLNNEIGHTLARAAVLQRENAQIGIEGSESSAGDLVEPQAAAAGMTFATPATLHFLTARHGALSRAASALSSPIQPAQEASQSPEAAASHTEATASQGEATASQSEAAATQPTAPSETSEQAPKG